MSFRDRTVLRGLVAGLILLALGTAARLAPSDPRLPSEPPVEVPRSDLCSESRASGCIVPPLTAAKIARFYRLPPGVEDRLEVDGSGKIHFAEDAVQVAPSEVTPHAVAR